MHTALPWDEEDEQPRARRGLRGLLADLRLPAPPLASLAGIAVLAALALGIVHLSSAGSAVPVSEPTAAGEAGAVDHAEADGHRTAASSPPDAAADPDGADGPGEATSPPPAGAEGGGAGESVLVHVSGAVHEPGVVTVAPTARVADAVEEAGGATDEADLDAVNLARPVEDGEQIHVPIPGEEPAPTEQAAGSTDSAADAGTGTVDLNTADAAALETLPGVGPAIAARIVEHRELNGPFRSVDDLQEVSGIGPATLEDIRPAASVG